MQFVECRIPVEKELGKGGKRRRRRDGKSEEVSWLGSALLHDPPSFLFGGEKWDRGRRGRGKRTKKATESTGSASPYIYINREREH